MKHPTDETRIKCANTRVRCAVLCIAALSGCLGQDGVGSQDDELRAAPGPTLDVAGTPFSATGLVYLVLPQSSGSAERGYYAMEEGPILLGHQFQSGATYTIAGTAYGNRVVVHEAQLERDDTVTSARTDLRSASRKVLFVPLWRVTESMNAADLDVLANDVRAQVYQASGNHLALSIDIAPSRVMTFSNTTDLCDELKPWIKEAKSYLRDENIRWRSYDYVVVVSDPITSCQWGGWGQKGGRWSSSFSSGTRSTVLHELGHNFGLGHASELDLCGASGNALLSLRNELIDETSSACEVDEYGDFISEMGSGGAHYGLPMSEFLQCKFGGFPHDRIDLDTLSNGSVFDLTPLPGTPTVASMSVGSWDGDVTLSYENTRVRVRARRGERSYLIESLDPGDVFDTGPNRRVRFVSVTGSGRARMEIVAPTVSSCPPESCPTYCAPVAGFPAPVYNNCMASCAAACSPPTCSDGFQNQGESGIDCGGPCPGCLGHLCSPTAATLCVSGAECISGACVTSDCPPDPCDQYCLGIGLGGPTSAFYAACVATCFGNCSVPTCTDGIHNGSEQGVDCGGSCPNSCPTCSDGIENGDETGVDCGGSCLTTCPDANCPTTSCHAHCTTGFGGPAVYNACMGWCVPLCE